MSSRAGPVAAAARATVSAYWTTQLPAACLAKNPVSIEKMLAPICRSTRTFKAFSYFLFRVPAALVFFSRYLLANIKTPNDVEIALWTDPFQVIQQTAAATDHHQQ